MRCYALFQMTWAVSWGCIYALLCTVSGDMGGFMGLYLCLLCTVSDDMGGFMGLYLCVAMHCFR